jgi:hypothetical protein
VYRRDSRSYVTAATQNPRFKLIAFQFQLQESGGTRVILPVHPLSGLENEESPPGFPTGVLGVRKSLHDLYIYAMRYRALTVKSARCYNQREMIGAHFSMPSINLNSTNERLRAWVMAC